MTQRRILVPVDGSRPSTEGLQYALREYPNAQIVALHVMAPVGWDPNDPPPPEELLASWYEQAQAEADRVLEDAKAVGDEFGADIRTELETGEPWRAIVGYAEANGFDHIVMGSHGQSGQSGVPLGSVAETVVRRAPAVVSVVR